MKALIAILCLAFTVPAMAQSSRVGGPTLPKLNLPIPLPSINAASNVATATPATTLASIMAQINGVTKDVVTAVVADIQAADNDAGTIVTPDIPATATTPDIPAVVKDPISHACYPAEIKFLQSLPQVATPTGKVVGVQLFQASRDFYAQIQAGLPTYLKLGCAPLLGDEINIITQSLLLVGVKIAPLAVTALMPALAPVTLPAMVLTP